MGIRAVETHVSWLYFGIERVFKFKRPVKFDFLDFSSEASRRLACEEEVRLNRRLSPDVYEGIAVLLCPEGRAEPAVVMRRLPADRSLSALVAGSSATVLSELVRIAERLAQFHRLAGRSDAIARDCERSAIERLWADNLAALMAFRGELIDSSDLDHIKKLAFGYLKGRGQLFDRRVGDGKAVDGHGDLLADDIFCLEDGPRLIDCLEFDDRLRHLDPLADVAFLAMDLERMGHGDLSRAFLQAYRQLAQDSWPESLAHHWIAQRALVRAKVGCLRSHEGVLDQGGSVRGLLSLALAHLQAGAVRLVLIGGGPGTGKSTLARSLSRVTGWERLSSDEIRKELAGMEPTERAAAPYGYGLYRHEVTEAVYKEMLSRARDLLGAGESVILDASWSHLSWRCAASAVAEETSSILVSLRCELPTRIAVSRILMRSLNENDASDATPEVVRRIQAEADPWPEAEVIDATLSTEACLAKALDAGGVHQDGSSWIA